MVVACNPCIHLPQTHSTTTTASFNSLQTHPRAPYTPCTAGTVAAAFQSIPRCRHALQRCRAGGEQTQTATGMCWPPGGHGTKLAAVAGWTGTTHCTHQARVTLLICYVACTITTTRKVGGRHVLVLPGQLWVEGGGVQHDELGTGSRRLDIVQHQRLLIVTVRHDPVGALLGVVHLMHAATHHTLLV